MELSSILAIANVGLKAVGGLAGKSGQKSLMKQQKQTAEVYYKFNKKQIAEAYNTGFSDIMTGYARERMNLADETSAVNSQLNMQAMQEGVNLADSSFKGDIQNQLNMQYEIGMQDLLTGSINQTSKLISNSIMQEMQNTNQYYNQTNNIQLAYDQAQEKSRSDLYNSILQLGIQSFDDYSDYKTRTPDGNLGNWAVDFAFLGGKKK
ncbi:MAG: hypothetical protein ACRCX2_06580 [Paraclostridium sp.]